MDALWQTITQASAVELTLLLVASVVVAALVTATYIVKQLGAVSLSTSVKLNVWMRGHAPSPKNDEPPSPAQSL